MKAAVYNQEGKEVEQIDLPKALFEVPWKADLVHQVVVSQESNRRRVLANTKGRGEVSGGGKKPWAQKHTGRARHGSIRSPLWKGGGVTFGPTKERSFKKKINQKMRKGALFAVLSKKAAAKLVMIVADAALAGTKTKTLHTLFHNLQLRNKKTLLVLPSMERVTLSASRNLPYVQTMQARELNAFDVMRFQYVVMPKESVAVIEKTFVK